MKKMNLLLAILAIGTLAFSVDKEAQASTLESMSGELDLETNVHTIIERYDNSEEVVTEFNEDDEVSILATKTTYPGGGVFKRTFSGNMLIAQYDHKSWIHKSSVTNSNTTKQGPWKSKTGGFSRSEIIQTPWGNKANWDIRVDGNIPK